MRKYTGFLGIEWLVVVVILLLCAASGAAFAQQIQLAKVPGSVQAGQCSAEVYVRLYEGGKAFKAATRIPVSLTSTGAGNVTFSSKADCSNQVSSVAIAAGGIQTKFYFSAAEAGTATINASAQSSGLNVASANVSVLSSAALGVEESEMVRTINRIRSGAGLGQLQVSASLTNAALWMANDMASNGWTSAQIQSSNNNYDTDTLGRNLWQRITAFGYFGGTQTYNGEMLIGGQPDALSTFYEPQFVYELNTAFTVPYATVIGVAHVYAKPVGWYWVIDFAGTNVDQTLSLTPAPAPDKPTQTACTAWAAVQPSSWQTNWTGNLASCNAGTIDSGSTRGTLALVNYYRSLVGLPAVVEDSNWDQEAQACSLVEAANFNTYGLSHSPQASWQCYTSSGAAGAAQSNLASINTQSAISDYMEDPGNTTFGHRSWILSNKFSTVGIGSTTTASCLKVVGGNPIPNPQPWVAWPAPGVVPINSLLSVDYTGWSVHSDTIDLSKAQVTVQSGGTNLPVKVAQAPGYGAVYGVSFQPVGWHSVVGNTYTVSVTGISSPIQYSVTIVGCY